MIFLTPSVFSCLHSPGKKKSSLLDAFNLFWVVIHYIVFVVDSRERVTALATAFRGMWWELPHLTSRSGLGEF